MAFKLKDIRDINKGMFAPTDPAAKAKDSAVYNLALNTLFSFKLHPFKLYSGHRFDDMVQSIRENGVLVPIIVRPIDDFTYEILSGHNRVEAAKTAGLEHIPAIVREGLTDEEALLIVTETNLLQRSFADMTHSERAVALSMHHEAIKRQGRRTDLIREIENMLNASGINTLETCTPLEYKLKTVEKIGLEYGLARETVARYLRINKLIGALKERLDNDEFAVRSAVTLSHLPADEQQTVDDILDSSHYKLDMKKAEALRAASGKRALDHETAMQILAGTKKPRSAKPAVFKLKPQIVSRYFKPEQKPDEIEATIIEALEFFYAHKNQESEVIPHGEKLPPDDAAGKTRLSESPVG
jgi:ParB family chromosome partitioning protein